MFGATKVIQLVPSPYATKTDFCRIFKSDMKGLYLLSFLLTADRTIAEQCFVAGLHTAQNGNQVFREWAESWARRAIVQNAIRMVRPLKATNDKGSAPDYGASVALTRRAEIAAVVGLRPFERFAFVMSVLEHYSDQECSLLLGCTRGDVAAARARALERLGKSAELQRRPVSTGSNQKIRRDNSISALQLTAAPSLAASA